MKSNDLTSFEILKKYYDEHKVLPSYSTIARLIGYKSKNSVFAFIERMKAIENISLTPENKIKPGKNFFI